MDYPIKTLAQLRPLLQGFRKRAGYTQAALAARLGITQQSYAQIEGNPATTSMERLYTIFRLLDAELVLTDGNKDVTGHTTPGKDKRPSAPRRVLPPSGQKEEW